MPVAMQAAATRRVKEQQEIEPSHSPGLSKCALVRVGHEIQPRETGKNPSPESDANLVTHDLCGLPLLRSTPRGVNMKTEATQLQNGSKSHSQLRDHRAH